MGSGYSLDVTIAGAVSSMGSSSSVNSPCSIESLAYGPSSSSKSAGSSEYDNTGSLGCCHCVMPLAGWQ